MKKTLLLLLVVLAGCGSISNTATTETTYTIGAIVPLTGPVSILGQQYMRGALLADEELDTLQINFQDSQADPKKAIDAYHILKDAYKVDMMISTLSGPTLALVPIADNDKMLMLTSLTSTPGIAEQGEYIFTFFPTADREGEVSAKQLLEKFSNFGVLYLNNDYGLSNAESFMNHIEDNGGVITKAIPFSFSDLDFRTLLLELSKTEPDVIYVVGYENQYLTSFKQAKELGLQEELAGNGILAVPHVLEKMNGTANGAYITSPDFYINPPEEFIDKYTTRFGMAPDAYSAFGYDSVMLISDALKYGDVKSGFKNLHYEGLMGDLQFDSNGEINPTIYPARIIDGGLVSE